MRRSFDAAAQRRIRAALNARRVDHAHETDGTGEAGPVPCPVCGGPLTESPIATPAALPYVRSRVMVVCPACESAAVVDVRAGGRP